MKVEANYLQIISVSTSIIAFAIIVLIAQALKSIFVPMIFAIFIAFMLAPLIRWFFKKKVPRPIILIIIGIVLLCLLAIAIVLVYTGVTTFANEFPKYQPKITNLFLKVANYFQFNPADASFYTEKGLNLLGLLNKLSLNNILTDIMNNFVSLFSYVLLTIFFVIFIVSDNNRFLERLLNLFFHDQSKIHEMLGRMEKQLITYLLTKTMFNMFNGFTSAVLLALVGVDFSVLTGLLIFVFGFIPEIGSVIAAIFPISFCFFEFGLGWQLVLTIIILVGVNSFVGNYIEPKVMGYRLNLSPIIILSTLVFWAWVWGPIGMFLAVPITSMFNIILNQLKAFKQFSSVINYDNDEYS